MAWQEQAEAGAELSLWVQKAKTDDDALSDLMTAYRPFIMARLCEVAIAEPETEVAAFYGFSEAVKAYEEGKGSFLALAKQVIRRRVIDALRKKSKDNNEVLLAGDSEENEKLLSHASIQAAQEAELSQQRREEIFALSKELDAVGMDFRKLSDASPRQDRTRERCQTVLRCILSSEEWMEKTRAGRLPVRELVLASSVDKKTIERHRRYFVAACIVHDGDYPLLKRYIPIGTQNEQRSEQ